jgi:hypothetical protein
MRLASRIQVLPPLAVLCLAGMGCADPSPRTGAVPYAPVTVRSSLDRTAAWVGDPVTYAVEIVCAPGYDIVADDLSQDRLPLEGLEMRTSNTTREARRDGAAVYRIRYVIASYDLGRERLRIGPMSIRYYRTDAEGRAAVQKPAGTVAVPGQDVVLRSTLPESTELVLRITKTPVLLPSFTRAIYPIGVALMSLSLVTVAVGFMRTIARRRTSTPAERSTPVASTRYETVLDEIRRLEATGDPDAFSHAFARLDGLLRDFLVERSIPARALTPDEIDARAAAAGAPAPVRAVTDVLRDCERVRYGGPAQPPTREMLAKAVDRAGDALASARGDAP